VLRILNVFLLTAVTASAGFAQDSSPAWSGSGPSWPVEFTIAIVLCTLLAVLWIWHRGSSSSASGWKDPVLDILDEGIVICSGLQVLLANRAFHKLLNAEPGKLAGQLITSFLPDVALIERLIGDGEVDVETQLRDAAGAHVAVTIKARAIEYQGAPARLLEVHDVRLAQASRERISFLADHDALTKLPNRRVLTDRLEEAIETSRRQGSGCAIAWADLDRFKMINDVFGHGIGDKLLVMLAERLTFEMPADVVIGRMGGDEFMVLVEEIDDPAEARLIGQQLRRLMNKTMVVDGLTLNCGASIGTAAFPADGDSAEELMRNADLALYDAKAEGRGRCRHFTPSMAEDLKRKLALAGDLKQAIEQREIKAVFQPVVRNTDCSIIGFETLARWTHPTLGPIAPPEFVRIAEENGLAPALAALMVQLATDAAAAWPDNVYVGVNISPVQLNRDFVEMVRSTLRAKAFDPRRLEIEVTEDALIRDIDEAALVFSRLREFGVQIAMDDFGAGFTALGNLKRLNFDRLKLDRSIVEDVCSNRRAGAILRSLFVLARELGIALTVEGVETAEEFTHLSGEGECAIQGFYFSKPEAKEHWDDFELRANELRLRRPPADAADQTAVPQLSSHRRRAKAG